MVVQDLLDEDNTAWPVTLSMASYGVAKRMFILEKIGEQDKQGRANQEGRGCMVEGEGMLTTCRTPASTTSGRLASMAMRGSTTRQCSTSDLVSTLPTSIPCHINPETHQNHAYTPCRHELRSMSPSR